MTSRFKTELEDIVTSFSTMSENSYTIQGELFEFFINTKNKRPTSSLLAHIANVLYSRYHCRQIEADSFLMCYDSQSFVESLSQANSGSGTWEPGWKIKRIEKNGQLAVQKNGLTLWVIPQQFIPNEKDVKEGTVGKIAMVKEYRGLLPGFYMANGNATLNQLPPLVRIYWNIKSSGAETLLKHTTKELNIEMIPFQFKTLNNPHSYNRTDAAVLYINKKDLKESTSAIQRIYEHVRPFLKPQTPLFAKRLADGISLAEDPHNGQSFGQNISNIFARALYNLPKEQKTNEKMLRVYEYFKNFGIDLHAPYINQDSYDDYELILKEVFA